MRRSHLLTFSVDEKKQPRVISEVAFKTLLPRMQNPAPQQKRTPSVAFVFQRFPMKPWTTCSKCEMLRSVPTRDVREETALQLKHSLPAAFDFLVFFYSIEGCNSHPSHKFRRVTLKNVQQKCRRQRGGVMLHTVFTMMTVPPPPPTLIPPPHGYPTPQMPYIKQPNVAHLGRYVICAHIFYYGGDLCSYFLLRGCIVNRI